MGRLARSSMVTANRRTLAERREVVSQIRRHKLRWAGELDDGSRPRLRYGHGVTNHSREPAAPVPLKSRQIDITTRMGALTPATPTGLRTLDQLLVGGLRTGTFLMLTGAPGVGKSALALFLSYMAARSGAAVLYATASLDETEIMARLSARALHRDWPEANTPYGSIWSGEAWQSPATRGPVGQAVETVVAKVGHRLHLHASAPLEPVENLRDLVSQLWGRHERVLLVVDDLESFSSAGAAQGEDLLSRVCRAAYGLRKVADQGCAVVATGLPGLVEAAMPAATQAAEIGAPEEDPGIPPNAPSALGVRGVDLVLTKNRLGPTGEVPLWFVAGAAIFQERG